MSQRGSQQTWGALKKAWRGYKTAKIRKDREEMKKYAKRIIVLQRELGILPPPESQINKWGLEILL